MEYYKNVKLKSFVVVLCVFSAVFANLIPNYSDPAKQIVYFDLIDTTIPLALTCIKPGSNRTYNLIWKKDGEIVPKVSALKNRFLTRNSIVIFNATEHDAGKYTCIVPNSNPVEEAHIEVVSTVYVEPLPIEISAVRTTRLEIHCKAHGTDPKIKWYIEHKEISNKTHIKFIKGFNDVENSTLVIENVERNDQHTYTCSAKNKATRIAIYNVSWTRTFVKVRGTVWGRVFNWFF